MTRLHMPPLVAALCVASVVLLAGCASASTGQSSPSSSPATENQRNVIADQSLAFLRALASHDQTEVVTIAGQDMDVQEWRSEAFGEFATRPIEVRSLRVGALEVDSSSPPPIWISREATVTITVGGESETYRLSLQGSITDGHVAVLGATRGEFW